MRKNGCQNQCRSTWNLLSKSNAVALMKCVASLWKFATNRHSGHACRKVSYILSHRKVSKDFYLLKMEDKRKKTES